MAVLDKRHGTSAAYELSLLPDDECNARLAMYSKAECDQVMHSWEFWGRPNQQLPSIPDFEWQVWLVKAGRGWGKTRTGAEAVRLWTRDFEFVNIIAPTADDARDICIEGESGILRVCSDADRPKYEPSKRRLVWPNGAISLIFTADEPERLRGKQHMKLWCDELAAWRYLSEAWDQAMFGLRLGKSPQAVVTTTPKPLRQIKELIASGGTFLTNGTTYENRTNLAPTFYSRIITKYEGTRLGRQELNAEVLEEREGALWRLTWIDQDRVKDREKFMTGIFPDLMRVVIGVDPAASSNEDSDETGIVAVGMDRQRPPHFYVFDDVSGVLTPDEWANAALKVYRRYSGDRIVAEKNNGGEMVAATIRHADENAPIKLVHASKGKITRAEPISALYEQHRVHHVGTFGTLEDQMCDYDPATAEYSPDRMDALVWALTELSEGAEQLGLIDWLAMGAPETVTETPRLGDAERQELQDKIAAARQPAEPPRQPTLAEQAIQPHGQNRGDFLANGNAPMRFGRQTSRYAWKKGGGL